LGIYIEITLVRRYMHARVCGEPTVSGQ